MLLELLCVFNLASAGICVSIVPCRGLLPARHPDALRGLGKRSGIPGEF